MIRIVRMLSFFGAILLSDFAHALEPECLSWFKVGKISPESASCVAQCSSLKVDLGTFYCPQRCEELCHPQKDGCDELKAKFRKFLSDGRPSKWEQESEKSKTWNDKEKDRIVESLLKLPLKLLKPDGVRLYRMRKSVHQGNPASNLESSIALYDEAFSGKLPLERVLGHEFAHLYYRSMSEDDRNAYNLGANWLREKNSNEMRPGRKASEFTQEDGVLSPEEDFSNNVEEALLNDLRLAKISPGVHRWLHNFFGDSLKLGGHCVPAPTKNKKNKRTGSK